MIKRSLYIMAVLLCSAVEIDAMSLNDALQSENIVLNFENGGTIWCQYSDEKELDPHPGYIKENEYLYDNNTYYLSLNTIPLFANINIRGGVNNYSFLANIGGSNNISLQNLQSNNEVNNEVIRSITFAGDNSQYKGTLYLTPSITKIIFEKEESIISNISIPDAFPSNSCKCCVNNYQDLQKSINIYLPDDGRFGDMNVLCNSKVILNSLCYHKSNLYFLNIKHFENNFSVADNISLVQLKYRTYGLQDININTTQNAIKMKENYYKALIKRNEKEIGKITKDKRKIKQNLIKTQKKLQNLENKLTDTENKTAGSETGIFNSIKEINDKIGTVDPKTNGDLQTQINDINNKDKDGSLANKIKTVETTNTSHTTDIKALNKAICGNETSLSYSNDNNINTRLTNLETDVGKKTEGNETGIFKNIKEVNDSIQEINTTIGKDDTEGLKKRIKDLENINWGNKIIDIIKINREEIYYVLHPLILTGECDAKFDYNDNYTKYYYTELKCDTCNTSITDQTSTSKPSELFSTLYCNTCKHQFTAQNIDVTSYLYPKRSGIWVYFATTYNKYLLLCSICGANISSGGQYFLITWGNIMQIYSYSSAVNFSEGEDKCPNTECSAKCYRNKQYIKNILNK